MKFIPEIMIVRKDDELPKPKRIVHLGKKYVCPTCDKDDGEQ